MMKRVLALSLFLAVVLARPRTPTRLEAFRNRNGASDRIINGIDTVPGQFPFMASMSYLRQHYCGASIISDEWVMTAGHCCSATVTNDQVGYGSNIHSDMEFLAIREAHQHPQYENKLNKLWNDICVVRVQGKMNLTGVTASAIAVEKDNKNNVALSAQAMGFGDTIQGSPSNMPNTLQTTPVNTITDAECEQKASTANLLSSHICTFDGSHGACGGDSGSPLIYDDAGTTRQIGLVSFGGESAGQPSCDPTAPSIYTEIAYFVVWIETTTGITFPPDP